MRIFGLSALIVSLLSACGDQERMASSGSNPSAPVRGMSQSSMRRESFQKAQKAFADYVCSLPELQAKFDEVKSKSDNLSRLMRIGIGKYLLLAEQSGTKVDESQADVMTNSARSVAELWLLKVYFPLEGRIGEKARINYENLMNAQQAEPVVAMKSAKAALQEITDIKDGSEKSKAILGQN